MKFLSVNIYVVTVMSKIRNTVKTISQTARLECKKIIEVVSDSNLDLPDDRLTPN